MQTADPLAPPEGWPAKGVVDHVGWLWVVVVRIRSVRSGRGLRSLFLRCPGRTPLARGLRLAGLIRWRSAAARPASRRCGQRSRPKSTRSEQRRPHPPAKTSAQPQPAAAPHPPHHPPPPPPHRYPHPPLRGGRAWWSMWWVGVVCLWCFVLLGLRRRGCGWYRPRLRRDFDYPCRGEPVEGGCFLVLVSQRTAKKGRGLGRCGAGRGLGGGGGGVGGGAVFPPGGFGVWSTEDFEERGLSPAFGHDGSLWTVRGRSAMCREKVVVCWCRTPRPGGGDCGSRARGPC